MGCALGNRLLFGDGYSWLTTFTVIPIPFNGCFDCRMGCLRQGYQYDGGTGPVIHKHS